MKAPDRATNNPAVKSWDYTLEQWAEIKNSLARVGINADTETVTTFESDPRYAKLLAALPGLRDTALRETLV